MISAVNCRPLNGFLLFRVITSPLAAPARHRVGKEIFKAATEPKRVGISLPGLLAHLRQFETIGGIGESIVIATEQIKDSPAIPAIV
jgi:hypothetical protein